MMEPCEVVLGASWAAHKRGINKKNLKKRNLSHPNEFFSFFFKHFFFFFFHPFFWSIKWCSRKRITRIRSYNEPLFTCATHLPGVSVNRFLIYFVVSLFPLFNTDLKWNYLPTVNLLLEWLITQEQLGITPMNGPARLSILESSTRIKLNFDSFDTELFHRQKNFHFWFLFSFQRLKNVVVL